MRTCVDVGLLCPRSRYPFSSALFLFLDPALPFPLQGLYSVETPVVPESNILCLRVRGSDARQLDVSKRILAEGDFYINSTQFRNKRCLRLVFMNPDATLDDVTRLMEQIRRFEVESRIA